MEKVSSDGIWRECWTIVGLKLLKSKKRRRLQIKWRAWSLLETGYLHTWIQDTLNARKDHKENGKGIMGMMMFLESEGMNRDLRWRDLANGHCSFDT